MKPIRTIEVHGLKYTVTFTQGHAIHPRLLKQRQVTICRIGKDSGQFVGTGIAYRRPTEPFNEVEGRSKAFARAVDDFTMIMNSGSLKKNVKQAFFQAFYNPPAKIMSSAPLAVFSFSGADTK